MSPDIQFTYTNITVSGLPGSGSTTLLKGLRDHQVLKFHQWSGFSGGEFMRAYAEEKGLFQKKGELHHDSRHYEDEFDRMVDFGMREKLENEQHWILESWLSGFMAQGVPKTLKVLMECSNKAVKIDRIVNRDRVTPDEALENMNARYKANLEKWQRMYAAEWQEWVVATGRAKPIDPIDFWREDLYDLVIDTYSNNQQESLELVLNAITRHNNT
jgi:cytidylate kinase